MSSSPSPSPCPTSVWQDEACGTPADVWETIHQPVPAEKEVSREPRRFLLSDHSHMRKTEGEKATGQEERRHTEIMVRNEISLY